ncbi:MAG: CRISPR-associated helicase Cas3', partial [Chloroflexi bacterium]|nr:CRISPR-associated helicase Cas3' [Chloroflexota bacterium]
MSPVPLYQLLWAKTNDERTRTHPLICHMLDVAQVALALWQNVLTESIRQQFCAVLGLNDDEAARVIAFWAGLHDLGKASPSFQRQYPPAITMLAKAGLDFETQVGQLNCRHDVITTSVLPDLLISKTGLRKESANQVAVSVGGHHGAWATAQDLDKFAAPSQVGGKNWDHVRGELVQCLKDKLHVPTISSSVPTAAEGNSFFTMLAGLTSTADWIGSQQGYFTPAAEDVNLDEYVRYAEQKALDALKETGWIGWRPPETAISFGVLCNVKQLRPLQEASVVLAEKLDQPALVIIEAPTGVGKTEAALYLADHWARTLRQRGMYVAMPTMATSNEMFKRVRQVLERRYPSELVNYQLLHGNALLMDDEQVPRLTKVDKGDDRNLVAALEWFTKRKRGLLAPFGVGTVDQTLMSILQTRHFFVRMFGLSHKTIIFDEVHAYDTYMDELFYLLLRWLYAIGASVVVLSATLSNASRRRILEAYIGTGLKEMPAVPYPAITSTRGNTIEVIPLRADTRTVATEHIGSDPVEIARRLAEELQEGGCAAVICNTVRRAQDVYRTIDAAQIVPEDDLILFHARFPWEWREEIESDVRARIGKSENGEFHSRKKTIVVATQVIEQSLDLDFDLMISDLAPIDLLIQRIGRLHRHSENDNQRPARLKEKRALIAMPDMENDVPKFERGETHVYEKYVLMRSWAVMRQRKSITTPGETQNLIEAIYGDETRLPTDLPESFLSALSDAREKMEEAERKAKSQAQSKLIPLPDDEFMPEQSNAGLEEDNPALHEYRQAATRLAPPSITLICL